MGTWLPVDDRVGDASEPVPSPPAIFEYTWYGILGYAMLGQAWGIVIPSVGGALLALLAAACVASVGARAPRVYAPVAPAICMGISIIAVQFLFYGGRALESSMVFIGWLFTVCIVQVLSLRPRFLNRFAMAAFIIGLGAIPYMQARSGGGFIRFGASGTSISNPNTLAMWFGFCAIFFLFWGLQSRTLTRRMFTWALALISLYIVALTVSRGTLLGIVLACLVGFRSTLKHGFLPAVSVVVLMALVYESGVFQQAIDFYTIRGTEETGRGKLWPAALQRLLDSPWTGYGLDAVRVRAAWNFAHTPHNALLYIGLGGGLIPLLCFLGYLARVGINTMHIMKGYPVGEATIIPALVAFAFIQIMLADNFFMFAWVVVVFTSAIMQGHPHWLRTIPQMNEA